VTLTETEAHELCLGVCRSLGLREDDAAVITTHLVDAELRGVVGLSRLLAIADDVARYGPGADEEIRVLRDAPHTALLDGGDRIGMVVAARATAMAIDKARRSGTAIVGANRHRFSGLLAHYVEAAAREGLVAVAAAAGGVRAGLPRVAPHGGLEGRFTTNPIAFGFPAGDEPIVWDVSTSAVSGGELLERLADGRALDAGCAIDRAGAPTVGPAEALAGALLTWGGHRGSGLAVAVHMLGMLCGLPAAPTDADGAAFLIVAIDPARLSDPAAFRARATALAEAVRRCAPVPGTPAVRMPYDRSIAARRHARAHGLRLPVELHARLTDIAGTRTTGHTTGEGDPT